MNRATKLNKPLPPDTEFYAYWANGRYYLAYNQIIFCSCPDKVRFNASIRQKMRRIGMCNLTYTWNDGSKETVQVIRRRK